MLKKARKIFRNSIILLVVFSISFSNVPFYTLTKILNSYIATNNIVDKEWHLSQNENVVDKFTSYRNVVEKARVYEAHAAALQYVGAAEGSGNSAAYNVSLTNLVGGSGGAVQTGDLVVVATGFVRTSNLNPGVGTAGYTEVADLYANDTRDANFSVNWKFMSGAPDTVVNCLGSGSTLYGAVCEVHVWRNADPTTPIDVTPTSITGINSAIPNSPAITPVTQGAVVLSLGLGTGSAADTTITAPTGYINKADIAVDPRSASTVGIASKAWGGAGVEDAAAWTGWTTSTSDSWGAVALAIRPRNDPPTLTVSQPDGVGDTVTVGDPYSVTYDLADPDNVVTAAMYYDVDATGLNGTAIAGACATAAEGAGVTCSWSTTGVTPGSYYVYGITSDGVNPQVSAYSPGMITINAPPSITSYTNTTEPALTYAAACTTCGARIGGGVGFKQSITITGTSFGTVAAGGRSSATNNIKIGTHQITDANITSWTPTAITFETDSLIAGDTDADWGTQYGGAAALTVTSGSLTSPGLNFYVFPQVTSILNCETLPGNAAREYDAGDAVCPLSGLKDGEVTLVGTRFGSSQGAGSVTVVNQVASPASWSDTAITVQVPVAITDSLNTGNISMTQGTGANSKTHTYAGQIRILPRITGFTPTSAGEGIPVAVNGNHFCQGASCPLAFGANDKVTFTSAKDATVWTTWGASAITTAVPVGAVTGNVVVTSDAGVDGVFTSNSKIFTVLTNTPADPTTLEQKDNNLVVLSAGASASSTPIHFYFDTSSGVPGGTMFAQVEARPVLGPNASFTSTCTANPYCTEGTGSAYAGGTINLFAASALGDESYHWQARTRYNNGGTDYFSAWVSFGANPEGSIDFRVDTIPPVITNDTSSNIGTNTATITWDTAAEVATKRVEYDTAGTFIGGYDCVGTTECTALGDTSPMSNGHSVSLVNLNSGTLYYYRVRSKDAAGNESTGATKTFTTSSNLSPAKTVKSYIDGALGVISAPATYYFTANISEPTPFVQSAYVEVLGVISGGVGTVAVQANGVASRLYDVSATAPTLYRLMYQIQTPNTETNLNLNDAPPCTNGALSGLPPQPTPPCNSLTISPSGVSMYVLSAKFITTYTYTP